MKLRPAVSIAAALAAISAVAAGSASAWVFAPSHGSSPTRNYVSQSGGPNNTNKGCDSPGFNSVQAAVDAVAVNGTVYLCGAATFQEQVVLDKSVTLTGDPVASISAPTIGGFDGSRFPSQFKDNNLLVPQAIVVVTGPTTKATIKGIDINGPLPGNGGCANREYGVLVLGGFLNLTQASVTNAQDADSSLNGCQFGVGVQVGSTYWPKTDGSQIAVHFIADAEIDHTIVSGYAKNGIVIDGRNSDGDNSDGDIHDNTVIGFGPTSVVAQNGIEIVRGATGEVYNNTISLNQYAGDGGASSTGVLLFGGCGDPLVTFVDVHNNTGVNNDIGISMNNYTADPNCVAPATTPTKNRAYNNKLSNSAVTNVSGFSGSCDSTGNNCRGYQAGIADVGNKDVISNNKISGSGYAPTDNATVLVKPIDATSTPRQNFWKK